MPFTSANLKFIHKSVLKNAQGDFSAVPSVGDTLHVPTEIGGKKEIAKVVVERIEWRVNDGGNWFVELYCKSELPV